MVQWPTLLHHSVVNTAVAWTQAAASVADWLRSWCLCGRSLAAHQPVREMARVVWAMQNGTVPFVDVVLLDSPVLRVCRRLNSVWCYLDAECVSMVLCPYLWMSSLCSFASVSLIFSTEKLPPFERSEPRMGAVCKLGQLWIFRAVPVTSGSWH